MFLSPDIPSVNSLKDIDPDNVLGYGEFSYYVLNVMKDDSVPLIANSDVKDYFTLQPTPKTFMNPANL